MKVKRVVITTLLSFIIIILAGNISTLREKTTAVDSEEKLKEVVLIRDNYKTNKNWNVVDIPDKIEIPENNKDVQVYEEKVSQSIHNRIFVTIINELTDVRNKVIGYHHKEI